ncbi:MAG TPA: helix-turn-helix transcriptional regulator [Acidimicrobiia bacterium]|nr:helix-turn-helix transcriptional regulator [Acidimicrobiia bacterium]
MSPAAVPSHWFLLAAKNLMDRDFAEPLTISDLAAAAFSSPAHFVRRFKVAFGETPHRYLQRRRIERAKEMLRNTQKSVTEICFAVGFSSLGTFSRTFKHLSGASPSSTGRVGRRLTPPPLPGCYVMMWTRPH